MYIIKSQTRRGHSGCECHRQLLNTCSDMNKTNIINIIKLTDIIINLFYLACPQVLTGDVVHLTILAQKHF